MLEGVGQDSRISPGDHEKVRLKGLFRIRDWTPESVVRVALAEPSSHLRIHVWGEGHGVSLFAGPRGRRLPHHAAARRSHVRSRISASRLASLVATDDRRGARLPPGAYQIRCQDGAVVVTKGNVRLMTVPLEGPAKALYIEVPYDATLQDLALFRSGPAPEEIAPAHRIVLDGKPPAELAWKETLPDGRPLPETGRRLRRARGGEHRGDRRWPAWPSPGRACTRSSPKSTRRRPAPASPCSTPKASRWTASNSAAKATRRSPSALAVRRSRSGWSNFDFANRPVPLAGPRQWLRLVVAGGSSKCWISGDGVHWGRALDGRDRSGSWQSIALYAREAGDRKQSGQCGPPHPPAKPAGPRAERAHRGRRRGFARQGGRGRRRHEDRPRRIAPGLDAAHRPPGPRGLFARGLALRLHAPGPGRAGATRRGRIAAVSRRARAAERSCPRRRPRSISCKTRPSSGDPARTAASGSWSFGTGSAAKCSMPATAADFELYQQALMQTSLRRSARTQRPHLLGACPRCHAVVLCRAPRRGLDPHGAAHHLLAGQRPAGRRLARRPATRSACCNG